MADDEKGEEELCQMINSVAIQTGLSECSSEAGRRRVIANTVGLRDEHLDFDHSDVLGGGVTEDVLDSHIRTRQYVYARVAEEGFIGDPDGDFYRVLNDAWDEINDASPLYDETEGDGDDVEAEVEDDSADDAESDAESDPDEELEGDIDAALEEADDEIEEIIEDLDDPEEDPAEA